MNQLITFVKAHKIAVTAGLLAMIALMLITAFVTYRLVVSRIPTTPDQQTNTSTTTTNSETTSKPGDSEEEEQETEQTEEEESEPQATEPIAAQPELKLYFYDMGNQTKTSMEQRVMPQSKVQWSLEATGVGLINENCKLTTNYTAPSQPTSTYVGPLNIMPRGTVGLNTSMGVGDHEFIAECVVDGKTYKAVVTAHITAYTASSCVSPAPATTSTAVSLTDLRNKVVGTWRGCMRWFNLDPDMAYHVEFIFNADGTYTASNYEIETNDDNAPWMYTNSATYWGDTNAPREYFIQSIDDAGTGYGSIEIHPSNPHIDLNKVQVAGDNIHFEIKDGVYGPLVYDLTKVTN